MPSSLDLQGRDIALFIDAGENTPAPFDFRQIFRLTAASHSTHALPPESVLQVYYQMEGKEPPPGFLLCVRGESFELGASLTPSAQEGIKAAMALLKRVLREPDLAAWLR